MNLIPLVNKVRMTTEGSEVQCLSIHTANRKNVKHLPIVLLFKMNLINCKLFVPYKWYCNCLLEHSN